ncbi:uncharacterized protein LOC114294253 [Camellia sinensis]|uniref:uncharacterized protein LOC114294253 n=1 Tax=Camellia sinensis TaxID=4442 RepID=UPI0010366217|nr:uncharacterized protein LOC114294253 [Camellia sinensis]
MIITGDDTVDISSLKQFLHRQFEMKDLDALSYFLGLEISQDSSGYFLTQAKYTSNLLARASLTDYKTITTPVDPQTRLTSLDSPLLSNATLYCQLVGSLVYLTLYAFSNADWAGNPTDRRSTTGFYFFLGNSSISWRSKKQTLVARSSTEAEYRALADTTQELVWLLSDMGVSHSAATNLYYDNQSAIQITADLFTKAHLPGRFSDLLSKLKLISDLPP